MTGAFNTQTQQMTQAAAKVDDVNSQVVSTLASLRSQVESILPAWKGAGATAFQTLMQRYQDDASKLSQALTEIAEQIRTSGQTYAQQDQAATDAVRSAGSGLNV